MRIVRIVREMRRRGVSAGFLREAIRIAKQMEEDVATSFPDQTLSIAARVAYQAKNMILSGEKMEHSLLVPVLRAAITLSIHFLFSSLMEGGHWIDPSSFQKEHQLPSD
jgi:uracil phosphoribosyltransferase